MEALTDDEREALHNETRDSLACRLQIPDASTIYDKIAGALAPPAQTADAYVAPSGLVQISTGDASLDHSLGGGIRTGAVWEVAGESSSGKTQFALQLTLGAVLASSAPSSVYYLSMRSSLPTERLLEMYHHRSVSPTCPWAKDLAPEGILEHIRFLQLRTSSHLLHILTNILPALASSPYSAPPLRLVIIDSLAPLVPLEEPVTALNQRERKETINEIASSLDILAKRFGLAVLVVNEVTDVFVDRSTSKGATTRSASTQGRYLGNRNHGKRQNSALENSWEVQADRMSRTPMRLVERGAIGREERKEAKLGFGWSYRLTGGRVMLSRTTRKWIGDVDEGADEPPAKKRRLEASDVREIPIAKRNLSVLFNKFGPRVSADFVLQRSGLEILHDSLWIEGESSAHGSNRNATSKDVPRTRSVQAPSATPNSAIRAYDAGSNQSLPSSAPARLSGDPASSSGRAFDNTCTPRSHSDPFAPHVRPAIPDPQALFVRHPSLSPGTRRTTSTSQPALGSSDPRPPDSDPAIDWSFYFPEGYDPSKDLPSEPDVDALGPGVKDKEEHEGSVEGDYALSRSEPGSVDVPIELDRDVFNDDLSSKPNALSPHPSGNEDAEEEDDEGGQGLDLEPDIELELDFDDYGYDDDGLYDIDLDYDLGVSLAPVPRNGETVGTGTESNSDGLPPSSPSQAETESVDHDERPPALDVEVGTLDVTGGDGSVSRVPSFASARSLPH